ncbi:MAG: beta-galactosidase [Planctomycetes bacterium]|nr:beta-galactosidase [Planctomycetota bacterium]
MQIGAQYYRPPFPNSRYWEDDLGKMADSGLNTVQLWVLWSWVEATPGEYRFDDYDRLVEIAGKKGLDVVLSTVAELQPPWIHREVPGSEMINQHGHRVVSTNRSECHYGITPGGCTDHPGVWRRMKGFLEATVDHYKDAPNLFGWDAWNELRWNVHAQGIVCYCEHTMAAYRKWLEDKYGGLDGLNDAWRRRYSSWEDVDPGRSPQRPFTEMMAYQSFIEERSNRIAYSRYEAVKSLDPGHPCTVHAAQPCVYQAGGPQNTALDRGNDWSFADRLDGIGTSSFPKWGHWDRPDYAVRMEIIRSAAGGKRLWLSELQGGRASSGFTLQVPVTAVEQQHWLYQGMAAGAEAVLFWCWRDEVFTTESGGFGIVGLDGHAEERIAAFRKTGKFIRENAATIAGYRPAPAEAGIFFSPQSCYLHWCIEGDARRASQAFLGYAKALVRQNIAFEAVEERHLDALEGLKILYMPRAFVLDGGTEERLGDFVRKGGTLVVESECGAYDSLGLYRYPEERFLKKTAGAAEVGRRNLPEPAEIVAKTGGTEFKLGISQWITPFAGKGVTGWTAHDDGILVGECTAGKGRVILVGTYLGEASLRGESPGFDGFVGHLAGEAGVVKRVEAEGPGGSDGGISIRWGESGGKKVVFVTCGEALPEVGLRFDKGFFPSGRVRDLVGGAAYSVKGGGGSVSFRLPPEQMLVLVEE